MKTSTFFRTLVTATLFAVSTSGLFAQVVVSNNQLVATTPRPANNTTAYVAANFEATVTETATVGAQMPYYVTRDANVNGAAFFNASTFKWTWAGITAVTDDAATPAAIASDTEVSNNLVIATMPATTGSATINTKEVSKPKAGTGCEGGITTVTITVVDKPTVSITEGSVGACAAAQQNLTLTLTGTAPFYVDYTISAVGLDGTTAVGSTKTYNATLATAATTLLIDPTQLLDVANAADNAAPQTSGKYTVTITKVWDKYSWKAINYNSIAAAPAAATDNYDIYIYPTPSTQQIQHIKNL